MTKLASRLSAAVLTLVVGIAFGSREARAQDVECYDAEVSARILSQIPTEILNCGDDCIIVSWPWFLDMDVRRVHSGDVKRGSLTVLAILHTSYRRDLGVRRWKLRRNDQGGFNLLRGEHIAARCPTDAPPAQAYITPREGQTLDDLRREGRDR
ncbi:hypothetical protein [Brevundimonas sp. NIBR11]|uniref:hypothetical protein n=1 Tax=Brevundimonas sp. NIBR11 TaxID=3015999 RepID=UPI0022F10EF5|nr:hypothetical protein [Brevundimonas sp. NIBR11]